MRRSNGYFLASWDFFLTMLGEKEELFPIAGMIFLTLEMRNERCHSGGIAIAYIMGSERESGDSISTPNVSLVHPHWKTALWKNLSRERQ